MTDHRHLWTGDSPRTTRCAFMGCDAKPTPAELQRHAEDVRRARAMRTSIDFSRPMDRSATRS